MKKLLAKHFKSLRSILRIALPFALLACLVTPLFGYLVHWAPADEALSRYKDETALLVGGRYRSYMASSNQKRTTSVYRERVYVLFPSMLREPKTVTVSQKNDEPYRVSEEKNGVFKLLAMYGLILFGTWWFWLRKPAKTEPSQH
ncbi:hypothetical protein NX786_26860 [Telluria mixta]|uniref:DUF3592 domain-containing protein n=1 Tax=Telluria mixta TaxID=34071 RepID=A0ABT2C6J7_9BURK|nr:hypothetical protein [Telluria mixta]MCS0632961.1 hypothetical protein [Telluria mixta]WEM98030.1 hypothetical protein P0M04_10010 [Telluria mixta]